MKKLLKYVVLPAEISEFERQYLSRMNRIALAFFALHVPVFMLIAWANDTGPMLAGALSIAALIGPAVAYFTLKNPRAVSIVYGVAAMCFGGLLVHFGQGPVQIEMHFYFFALVAMCAVFGNPLVIVSAAVTVALHHLVVWLVLPRSVFNYDAAWWVVVVHAVFVVLESVAACFIAYSFFDNVIGLEKIVQARTQALVAKNRDMRLLLDNVVQGFLTIDLAGVLAQERSAAVDRWFGAPAEGASWFDYLSQIDASFGARSRLAWDEVAADLMPLEVTLEQMPREMTRDGKHLRVEYRAFSAERVERFLIVVTDETAEIERAKAEVESREAMALFERVLVDRAGLEAFYDEACAVVDAVTKKTPSDLVATKRMIHTLKGNAGLIGLGSLEAICHEIEDVIASEKALPDQAGFAALVERWSRLSAAIERLLGNRARGVELDDEQYRALVAAVRASEPTDALLKRVRGLRLEPAQRRLTQFAEQARRISGRLEKDVVVTVEDNGVWLDPRRWNPFWSSFIHAVRNALDHGIELPGARAKAGKTPTGAIVLRTVEEGGSLVIEIEDDGKGIDWKAIGEKALSQGVSARTPDELEKALFIDGLTTAVSVTDLSGRGVGMGALLQATRALGGEMAIRSRPGAGTTLRMTFPSPSSSTESLAPAA